MHYSEFQSTDVLSEYVQTIWALESENEQDVYPRSLIMPDGIVEIVFHYRQPFYFYQNNSRFLQDENVAVSMMKKFIEIESAGSVGFIAVRFYPWGAYHFFDEPVSNFLDTTIDANVLWGKASKQIITDLKSANTGDTRFKLVEQFLRGNLVKFKKNETKTDEALKLIRKTKGTLSI